MFCPNCGTQLDDDRKFCPRCGETLAQPVQPFAPETHPVQPVQPETPQKPKKKSKLPLVILALVLVAAVAGAAWFFLLAPETVYLLEKHESTYPDFSIEYEYEYDESGRLLSYESDNEKFSYEYEDGRIVSATIEDHSGEYELEYVYDGDVLVEVTGEDDNGVEIEATCDEDGRIEEIIITYADSSEKIYSYTYDDDGNLEEEVSTRGDEKIVRTYEDGLEVEYVIYDCGEQTMRLSFEYDEMGNEIKYVVYTTDDEIYYSRESEYTYDEENRIISVTTHEIVVPEDEIEYSYEYSYEVEWEDDTFAIVTYEGNTNYSYGEWEYDEHGNLIRETYFDEDGEVREEITYTYVEVKVPRNYQEFNKDDPIWFMGLFFG